MQEQIQINKQEGLNIKGFIDNSSVVLTTNKKECFSYLDGLESFKEINFNFEYLKKQIIDIKKFKKFLRKKDILEFRDLIVEGLNIIDDGFKIVKDGAGLIIYLGEEKKSILSFEYIKAFFNEFKVKDIDCLEVFFNKDIPAYFRINLNEGLLIAPRIEE